MNGSSGIIQDLQQKFGEGAITPQPTRDEIPTLWMTREKASAALRYLKAEVDRPYRMLYDLTAIDERTRSHRQGQPDSDFTVVYHLLSFERNEDVRIKVALEENALSLPSIIDLWPAANWYE